MAYLVQNELNFISDVDAEEDFQLLTQKQVDSAFSAPQMNAEAMLVPGPLGEIDLTGDTASEDIGGALFQNVPAQGSGTGNYDTVLAIGGNAGVVDGFTTDATSQDRNNDGSSTTVGDLEDIDFSKTIAFQLGQLTIVEVDGVQYYEFRYDLNEPNNANDGEITLETFTLYTNPDGSFVDLGDMQTDGNTTEIYDMDAAAGQDVFLRLDENSNGSGTDDYRVLIPVTEFAGSAPTDYVYLYVEMGRQDPPANLTEEGGFEEWRADLTASTISGFKFEDLDGDGLHDEFDGENGMEGIVIFLDEDGDGLDFIDDGDGILEFNGDDEILEEWTVTDEDGNYAFVGLAPGTYTVSEIIPDGYDVSTGPFQTIVVEEGTNYIADDIGNFLPDPQITIDKEIVDVTDTDLDGFVDAGDVINYTVEVSNAGNVDLTNVVVSDPLVTDLAGVDADVNGFNDGDTDEDGELDVGETWLYEGTYTITQADMDNSGTLEIDNDDAVNGVPTDPDVDIDNVATASAEYEGETVGPVSDSAEQPLDLNPSFTILKEAEVFNADDSVDADQMVDSPTDYVTYTITLENDGNVALEFTSLVDPLLGPITLADISGDTDGDGFLDVGETWVYTSDPYSLTQDELDAECADDATIENTATGTFVGLIPEISSVDVGVFCDPQIAIDKDIASITDTDLDGLVDAGDVINYTVEVSNPGNISLTNVQVSDPLVTDLAGVDVDMDGFNDGDTDEDGKLDVDETWLYEGTYTITQADMDSAGTLEIDNDDAVGGVPTDPDVDIDNEATATSNEAGPVSDTAEQPLELAPEIDIVKEVSSVTNPDTTDGGGVVDQDGDVVNYTIEVSNPGNVALDNVTVTDPLITVVAVEAGGFNVGDTDMDGLLDVDETWQYTGSYTAMQDDIDAWGIDTVGDPDGDGDIDNIATVTATDPLDAPVEASDDAVAPIDLIPNIEIIKDVASITNPDLSDGGAIVDQAGDVVNYTIQVNNTGNVALSNVVVTDPLITVNAVEAGGFNVGDTDMDGLLDVDETWQYEGSYTVQQSDIDNNGIDEFGVGDNDGDIDNVADVTAQDPEGTVVMDDDPADVALLGPPAIEIVKDVDFITNPDLSDGGGVADEAGDVITYAITVNNIGAVRLFDVVVTDPLITVEAVEVGGFNVGDLNMDGILDLDESWQYTGTYTVTQDDLDDNGIDENGVVDNDGDIDNVATVNAVDLIDRPVEDSDEAVVPLDLNPEIAIDKEILNVTDTDMDGFVDAGDIINYTVEVSNAGNVSLTNVQVSDPLISDLADVDADMDGFNDGDTDEDGELDVTETWLYEGTYEITQADMDDGGGLEIDNDDAVNGVPTDPDNDIDNEATAEAEFNGNPVGPVSDTAEQPLDLNPAFTIDKEVEVFDTYVGEGDPGNVSDADQYVDSTTDTLEYTITLNNTGNVALEFTSLVDPMLGVITLADINGDDDGDGFLDVDETWTFVGTTSLTEQDLEEECSDNGDQMIENTATATFVGLIPLDDTVTVNVACPEITIDKEIVDVTDTDLDGFVDAGDVINYTVEVSNAGNVDLTNVVVSDPLVTDLAGVDADVNGFNDGDTDEDGELDVGETWLYEGTYTITQADMDNSGTLEIDNDDAVNGVPTDPDVDIDNVATASAEYEGETVGPVSDSAEQPLDLNPSFTILKEAEVFNADDSVDADQMVDSPTDYVTYTITLENDGNVALEFTSLVDPLLGPITLADISGDTDGDGFLDVGETWVYTSDPYSLTQDELDAECADDATIENTATGTFVGLIPEISSVDVGVFCDPQIAIDKEIDSVTDTDLDGLVDAGDVINYTVEVSNPGNISLTNVQVSDPLVTDLAGVDVDMDGFNDGDTDEDGKLDVDETWLYEGTYTITQADMDSAGTLEIDNDDAVGGVPTDPDVDIDNEATATSNEAGPVSDTAEQPLDLDPDIEIIKDVTSVTGGIDGMIIDSAGDVVNYSLVVNNTGNVALDNVVVSDPLLALPTGTLEAVEVDNGGTLYNVGDLDFDGLLDVDESWEYVGTYEVTPDDIASDGQAEPNDLFGRGSLDNLAMVEADDPDGTTVSDDDDASVPIVSELGWFGTPGFWKNWTEFFDGIPDNQPKQSGEDFFPDGEMTVEFDGESGVWLDCNEDGIITEDEFWSSEWLIDALEGGGKTKGPRNAVDTISRDLAALILNIAASPQNAGPDDPNDGIISPIELVKWAQEWLDMFGDGMVRTNSAEWKEPQGDIPISAQQMHEFIDEANNFGTVDGIMFGVDRDMEEYGLPDEFIEAYHMVEAHEAAVMDAMLEDKTTDAFVDHYTDTKEGLSIYDTAVPKGEEIDDGFALNFASFDGREFSTNFGEAMSYFDAADAFPMASEYLAAFDTSALLGAKFDANPAYARNLPVKDYSALNTLPQDAIAAFMKSAVVPGEVGESGEKVVQFFDDDDQGMVNFF